MSLLSNFLIDIKKSLPSHWSRRLSCLELAINAIRLTCLWYCYRPCIYSKQINDRKNFIRYWKNIQQKNFFTQIKSCWLNNLKYLFYLKKNSKALSVRSLLELSIPILKRNPVKTKKKNPLVTMMIKTNKKTNDVYQGAYNFIIKMNQKY